MKGAYNNSNWPQIKTGIKNAFIFLVAFTAIAFVGSSQHPGWLLLVCPVVVGGAAYAVSTNTRWFYNGVAIGLVAAALYLIFGI